ncbi:MAG TPA: outer membrane lipid asymmetry maintenance protein MlaD [Steroidobacteraceae bacterium]
MSHTQVFSCGPVSPYSRRVPEIAGTTNIVTRTGRSMDIGTGLFVLLGFVAIGYLVAQLHGSAGRLWQSSRSYTVDAQFDNIGTLKIDAPVKMAGVRVGRVEAIGLDPSGGKAKVTLRIESRYDRIPLDSSAGIFISGLLGGAYISITPGGSEGFLRAGGQIDRTQSALGIENLINKVFAAFSGTPGQAKSRQGSK